MSESNPGPGARRRKRVCVIGNSLIGALKKAYAQEPPHNTNFELVFLGTPGMDFAKIAFDGRSLSNIHFADGPVSEASDISNYDGAIIYADMSRPRTLLRMYGKVDKNRFSEALRSAYIKGRLPSSYHLCLSLAGRKDFPVFLLSKNEKSTEKILPAGELRDAIELMNRLVHPATYIPAPPSLFSDTGKPLAKYYSGSIDMSGTATNQDRRPLHDTTHLNQAGGQIVLTAILESLSQRFSS